MRSATLGWQPSRYEIGLGEFPNMKRWLDARAARPAVAKGMDVGKELRAAPSMDDEAKKILFGQDDKTLKR